MERLYTGASSLGHLYSRDTWWTPPFQGTQNLVPEKCSHNLCICYLYWRDCTPLFRGMGHFFGSRNLGLTSIQRTPQQSKMAIAFKTWINSLKSMYCTCGSQIRRNMLIQELLINHDYFPDKFDWNTVKPNLRSGPIWAVLIHSL